MRVLLNLPNWHRSPVHCGGHSHRKPPTRSKQVPPCSHGPPAHSSMSVGEEKQSVINISAELFVRVSLNTDILIPRRRMAKRLNSVRYTRYSCAERTRSDSRGTTTFYITLNKRINLQSLKDLWSIIIQFCVASRLDRTLDSHFWANY